MPVCIPDKKGNWQGGIQAAQQAHGHGMAQGIGLP